MPDETVTADAPDIIADERSMPILAGLIGIEFATLLALLIWMR